MFSRTYKPTYTAPKPTYRPTTVYRNNTTIVQQSVQQRTSPSSGGALRGGGMFSNIVGTVIGMGVYNWLFGDDAEKQPEAPVVAPAPVN